MVDYLLLVLKMRITKTPAMVAAAILSPAFHQTMESPCINPNCFICLQFVNAIRVCYPSVALARVTRSQISCKPRHSIWTPLYIRTVLKLSTRNVQSWHAHAQFYSKKIPLKTTNYVAIWKSARFCTISSLVGLVVTKKSRRTCGR